MRILVPPGKTTLLVHGDITLSKTDAIVNAANSTLMGGGGVDGAIHAAGGPEILKECKKIRREQGPLPTGKAVATTGGKLAVRYVIHTVGPVWKGGKKSEAELLRSCYRESLLLAESLDLRSVAFPSISTGAFGYPIEEAAAVALPTVVETLQQMKSIAEAHFVLFDEFTLEVYRRAARELWSSGKFAAIRIDS